MSNYPAKFLPYYLIAVLFFFALPSLCLSAELSEMQQQARIYRDKGRQAQDEGNAEEALSCYQKAVILDPLYAVAYNDAGVVLEALGQPLRAEDMYRKAIEADPSYPNSYSNLALLYEGQNDYTNAVLFWIKRAVMGGPSDPWAEAARKRLGDIARVYPEAFSNIGDQYKANIQQINKASGALNEFGYLQPQAPNVTLFQDEGIPDTQQSDIKTRALDHFARAKEKFSQGDYVAALKESTVAEYLDSSNEEIKSFVEKVRRMLYSK